MVLFKENRPIFEEKTTNKFSFFTIMRVWGTKEGFLVAQI